MASQKSRHDNLNDPKLNSGKKSNTAKTAPLLKDGNMNDPEYLKKYVKNHPDNQMSWYLLGKQYMEQGKKRKANECFANAGEIYEAFEQKPAPIKKSSNKKSAGGSSEKSEGKKRVGFLRFMFIFAVAMIAMMALPPSQLEQPQIQDTTQSAAPAPSPATTSSTPSTADTVSNHQSSTTSSTIVVPKGYQITYSTDQDRQKNAANLINSLLTEQPVNDTFLLLQAKWDKNHQWVLWTEAPDLLLSADYSAQKGKLSVFYHDPKLCDCQVSDSSDYSGVIDQWTRQREQQMVLYSAIVSYDAMHHQWPQTIDKLAQNYPNNMIPGFTSDMKKSFPALLAEAKNRKQPDAEASKQNKLRSLGMHIPQYSTPQERAAASPPSQADSQSSGPSSQDGKKPFFHELKIVIDKTNHRLALMNGNIIIRNYPIGLGGKRTPEGHFEITEKVKNPNGHSNGDFGSRGMALSHTLYAIHGTNRPSSIGKDLSHGCIRMKKADIEELFDLTPLHTPVTIGKNVLPDTIRRGKKPFHLQSETDETNPHKIYHWL